MAVGPRLVLFFHSFVFVGHFDQLSHHRFKSVGRDIKLRRSKSLLQGNLVVLHYPFDSDQRHCADVGSVVADELEVEVLEAPGNDFRHDGLQLVKLDLGIEASELSGCAKADNETLERGNQVRSGHEHKHEVVEN